MLTFLIEQEGGKVVTVESGADPLRKVEAATPDVIVLDGSADTLVLCRRIRAIAPFVDTPVIVLAERNETKYQAFQAGATDVMTRPLDQLEFQYRLRVHLKAWRRMAMDQEAIAAGPLTLQPATLTAEVRGHSVALTPSEFTILRFLASHPGRPVSTEELLVEALGEPRTLGNPQVIHTHIRNLRRKLEADPAKPQLICSSRLGYRIGEASR